MSDRIRVAIDDGVRNNEITIDTARRLDQVLRNPTPGMVVVDASVSADQAERIRAAIADILGWDVGEAAQPTRNPGAPGSSP